MASQIYLANWALIKVGSERIAALDDDVERAEIITELWDQVRDDELRARNWRFSMFRDNLEADVDAPAWGFTRQYTIPGGCVRVVQVSEFWTSHVATESVAGGETAPYLIEGDKILTDLAGSDTAVLPIRYARNSVDIGLWDPCFGHAFACRLGKELTTRLTESSSRLRDMEALYRDAIRTATRANAIEHPPRQTADPSWITSRFTV